MSTCRCVASLASSLLLVAAAAPTTRAGGNLAVARVVLDLRWGEGSGSDEFRDEMQRAVVERLAMTCFTSVALAESPAGTADSELTLTVLLSDTHEDVRFDDSIADTLQPGDPQHDLRRAAHCEVTVDAKLAATATGTVVVRKRFTTSVTRRPMVVGEDPQVDARAEVVKSASRQISKSLGCGGAKLPRKIHDALGHEGEAPPSR